MRDGGKIDIPEIGFTAQNLKTAQTTLNITIPNLVNDNNPDRLEVAPGVLIPILVKSIQELSNQLFRQYLAVGLYYLIHYYCRSLNPTVIDF